MSRGTTLNRLIDEMTTLVMAEYDTETRFQLRAAQGAERQTHGLPILAKAQIRAETTRGPNHWARAAGP